MRLRKQLLEANASVFLAQLASSKRRMGMYSWHANFKSKAFFAAGCQGNLAVPLLGEQRAFCQGFGRCVCHLQEGRRAKLVSISTGMPC